jgi:hypothetical protein
MKVEILPVTKNCSIKTVEDYAQPFVLALDSGPKVLEFLWYSGLLSIVHVDCS